ncbi:hypothetical protein [Limnohabitans planktonicus]|uniref:hypothetical protein n=1 Tax=Limnohabitans planktonicus TaxID=540060 RepID=UPI001057C155|nr:hypothetical protein [Limnohabitans planktonicus]
MRFGFGPGSAPTGRFGSFPLGESKIKKSTKCLWLSSVELICTCRGVVITIELETAIQVNKTGFITSIKNDFGKVRLILIDTIIDAHNAILKCAKSNLRVWT